MRNIPKSELQRWIDEVENRGIKIDDSKFQCAFCDEIGRWSWLGRYGWYRSEYLVLDGGQREWLDIVLVCAECQCLNCNAIVWVKRGILRV